MVNENQPYTSALNVNPVDPERDFARSIKDGGYEAGIAGSQGRTFARDPYEGGGAVDNVLRQRQMAEESLDLSRKITSRNMQRANWASMDLKTPENIGHSDGS